MWILLFQYRVKIKESLKINKYLDLARALKKLCFLKVTVVLIVVGALGMVTKGLKEDWENWTTEEGSGSSRVKDC